MKNVEGSPAELGRAKNTNAFVQGLTAWVESISLMEWSYCSAKMANFLVCSSLSLFSTAL